MSCCASCAKGAACEGLAWTDTEFGPRFVEDVAESRGDGRLAQAVARLDAETRALASGGPPACAVIDAGPPVGLEGAEETDEELLARMYDDPSGPPACASAVSPNYVPAREREWKPPPGVTPAKLEP